ncbi:hypothetical protein SEVIR_2G177033v4 [Setaria viridis]
MPFAPCRGSRFFIVLLRFLRALQFSDVILLLFADEKRERERTLMLGSCNHNDRITSTMDDDDVSASLRGIPSREEGALHLRRDMSPLPVVGCRHVLHTPRENPSKKDGIQFYVCT